jgi:pyridoxal phosphate enzyme (YggS family)
MSEGLADRYRRIAGALPSRVTLVAVSKSQPIEAIEALYRLGQRDFGENYVQELLGKAERLRSMDCDGIRWHFIGHLQTNKVKVLLPWIHAIHSVDSERLAAELDKRWRAFRADEGTPKLPCFLEVNIDREESKSGVLPEDAVAVATSISTRATGLKLEGLMAIPAPHSDVSEMRRAFAKVRELELNCQPHTAGRLSMGMSGDYELAIAEGATHVRIGTALFGVRKPDLG